MFRMIQNPARREERVPRLHTKGFTLLELLVVMTVIGILAGLLVPTLGQVRIGFYNARTKARVTELAQGATSYASDHRNLYPGQMYPEQLENSRDPTKMVGMLTGNQVLAACLFGIRYVDVNSNDANMPFSPIYATCTRSDLAQLRRKLGAIWDLFPGTIQGSLPLTVSSWNGISYFPATRGDPGLTQFVEVQNWRFVDSVTIDYAIDAQDNGWGGSTAAGYDYLHPWLTGDPDVDTLNLSIAAPTQEGAITSDAVSAQSQQNFQNFIRDRRFYTGTDPTKMTPYNSGSFLFIAAGPDRVCGTLDDVKNFGQ